MLRQIVAFEHQQTNAILLSLVYLDRAFIHRILSRLRPQDRWKQARPEGKCTAPCDPHPTEDGALLFAPHVKLSLLGALALNLPRLKDWSL